MNDVNPEAERMAQWRDSMLSESSVRLLALARNYLGHVGSLVDKGKIVSGLTAMVSKPEVQIAAMALMDRIDKLIVGIISVAGDMDKPSLQKMLAGEISYHEMEYRLANLTERLILFQTRGETFALNPLFDESVRSGAARSDILFGPGPIQPGAEPDQGQTAAARAQNFGSEGQPHATLSVQELGLIAYTLLQESRNLFLKNGELSARAKKRITILLRGDKEGVAIVEAIIHALYRAGIAQEDDRGPLVDFRSFADFLMESGHDFPFAICLAYANGLKNNPYTVIAKVFSSYFEHRFTFSDAGLGRFIRLALADKVIPETICSFPVALKDFGLLEEKGEYLRCSPERIASRWPVSSNDDYSAISVEGTGIVHVLPSASLRDVIALLDIGNLESASGAWSVSITRESSRRTFAAGWKAGDIEQSLEMMGGTPIPQTLRFDLARWEEEYNSIRLFRGYVLAADGQAAKVIEGSGALSRFPHEKIGEGLYYFGSVQVSALEMALIDLGLPPPALRALAKNGSGKARRFSEKNEIGQREYNREPTSSATQAGENAIPVAVSNGESTVDSNPADDHPEKILFDEIAHLPISEQLKKQVEERVRRKLVYSLDQLHAMVKAGSAEAKASGAAARLFDVGFVAGGLDFNGKVRIIQTALKAKFSRLDIRWAADGEIKTGLVRPVSLRKIERDYMLEGEEVVKGLPVSIRVGSMMQVGLQKGFLLGDE